MTSSSESIDFAIDMLKCARKIFLDTKHPHTAERIRLAISSARGAKRIENNRIIRAERNMKRRNPPKNSKVRNAVVARIARMNGYLGRVR